MMLNDIWLAYLFVGPFAVTAIITLKLRTTHDITVSDLISFFIVACIPIVNIIITGVLVMKESNWSDKVVFKKPIR